MKYIRRVGLVVVVLIIGAVAWNNCQIGKANKIKDEANAAIVAANEDTKQAAEKLDAMTGKNLTADRDQIKTLARAAVDLLVKSAAGFRTAAAKLQQAAEEAPDDIVKQYITLSAQSTLKLAESKEIEKERIEIYLDDSITDIGTLEAKQAPIAARAAAIFKEHEALDAQATKLAEEHKDKIKT